MKERGYQSLMGSWGIAIKEGGENTRGARVKKELIKEGHKFHSETDTEVIVHLVEKYFKLSKDSVRQAHDAVEKAFIKAIKRLEGTYAVAMVTIHEKDKIFCAKKESPLVIGIGGDTNYIGSDFNAFIDYTKNAVVLDDDEYAIVCKVRTLQRH